MNTQITPCIHRIKYNNPSWAALMPCAAFAPDEAMTGAQDAAHDLCDVEQKNALMAMCLLWPD